jgi:hypothetical protein
MAPKSIVGGAGLLTLPGALTPENQLAGELRILIAEKRRQRFERCQVQKVLEGRLDDTLDQKEFQLLYWP